MIKNSQPMDAVLHWVNENQICPTASLGHLLLRMDSLTFEVRWVQL